MWELFLQWLPTLSWIVAGTLLLSWITEGLSCSMGQVFGYSNTWLFGDDSERGIVPDVILSGGICSVGVILFWVMQTHLENVSKGILLRGIMLGGIIGGACSSIGITELLRKRIRWIVRTIIASIREWNGERAGGMILGLILGSITAIIIGYDINNLEFVESISIGLASGLIAGLVGGAVFECRTSLPELLVTVSGLLVTGFGSLLMNLVLFWGLKKIGVDWLFAGEGILVGVFLLSYPVRSGKKAVSFIITPLLILLHFRAIVCNHCLRYTSPLKSRYKMGKRYCEHCHQEVEYTKEPGKVILSFGNFGPVQFRKMQSDRRVFLLKNPDLEQKAHAIDVSSVYIATKTCDQRLLERFLTYLLNYPPKRGLKSVRVFYRGSLHRLGDNLKNALQNTFRHIKQLH